MICPTCKGSGMSPMPHFPSSSGGWLDEMYHSGMRCGACGSRLGQTGDGQPDGHDKATEPPPANLSEAELRLKYAQISFKARLEISQIFPVDKSEYWVRELKALSVHQPRDGLALLDRVETSYHFAKRNHRPAPGDTFQSASKEMNFGEACIGIERELESLRRLVEHVCRHLGDKTATAR